MFQCGSGSRVLGKVQEHNYPERQHVIQNREASCGRWTHIPLSHHLSHLLLLRAHPVTTDVALGPPPTRESPAIMTVIGCGVCMYFMHVGTADQPLDRPTTLGLLRPAILYYPVLHIYVTFMLY